MNFRAKKSLLSLYIDLHIHASTYNLHPPCLLAPSPRVTGSQFFVHSSSSSFWKFSQGVPSKYPQKDLLVGGQSTICPDLSFPSLASSGHSQSLQNILILVATATSLQENEDKPANQRCSWYFPLSRIRTYSILLCPFCSC